VTIFFLLLFLCVFSNTIQAVNLDLPKRDQLQLENRFAELEEYMHTQIGTLEKATTEQLFYLCNCYSKLKKYDELFSCVDQMEKNIARGDKRFMSFDLTVWPLMYRTEAYIELGRFEEAAILSAKAVAMVVSENLPDSDMVYSLSNAGLAHALNNDKEKALAYLHKLKKLDFSNKATVNDFYQFTGLAKGYVALGDYEKGLAAVTQARNSSGNKTIQSSSNYFAGNTWAFFELPLEYLQYKCYLETGNIRAAKLGYDNLLLQKTIVNNPDLHWMTLSDRAKIASLEGENNDAIDLYKQAINIFEHIRSSIKTETSKIGFVGDKQEVYERIIKILITEKRVKEAFEYSEKARARALVDLLAQRFEGAFSQYADSEALELIDNLYAKQKQFALADERISHSDRKKRSLNLTEAQKQLERKFPELASLVSVSSVSIENIQKYLGAEEILIEYYISDNSLNIFTVSRDNLNCLEVKTGNLKEKMWAFRHACQDSESSRYMQLGQELYEVLIQPVFEELHEKKYVIIVPHRWLHYLPFNALASKENVFIESFNVRQLPSASVLLYLREDKPKEISSLLLIGNPDVGDPQLRLPGTEKETKQIATIWSPSQLLLGKAAVESKIKKEGSRYDILHFATHGIFRQEDPLKSELLLSPDATNDGHLTVSELYSLNLKPNLVVMSACNTGLGSISDGDDVIGLTRGFLFNGAQVIVSTLWSIADEESAYFMTAFYNNLKKHECADAFQLAVKKCRKKYPHPFYWAGFQLIGKRLKI